MDSHAVATALRLLADAIEAPEGSKPRARALQRAKPAVAASGSTGDDGWVSQQESPLGARRHMRLCKAGTFPSARKEGRRWLVRRTEIDAYIEKKGKAPATGGDETDRFLSNFRSLGGSR